MIVDILTLFPDMFRGPFDESIIKKAKEKKLVKINIHNLRKWAIDKRGTVDDRPYGGGKGMILRPEPIDRALDALKVKSRFSSEARKLATKGASKSKVKSTTQNSKVILLSPSGKVFNQKMAQKLAKLKWMTLICGHYEGVDYRVHQYLADEVISIGDYVLTGGEIPAMVLVDAIVRLLPNVLKKEATEHESFSPLSPKNMDKMTHVCHLVQENKKLKKVKKIITLLEYPQYTRPEVYKGHQVPKVLLSGNHQKIAKWRLNQSLKRTHRLRPDLLK